MKNLLSNVQSRVSKILITSRNWILGWGYPQTEIRGEQTARFFDLGLDYRSAEDATLALYETRPDLAESSEHHKLFAGIAIANPYFLKVLEIGTHRGIGASVLSVFFPNCEIHSIDLPANHPEFIASYGRSDDASRSRFVEQRNSRLRQLDNVVFKESDSLALTLQNDQFDFIWVDGAHNFPVVAVDVANAIRLLRPGGIVAVDDVFTSGADKNIYRSIGADRTLRAFSKAGLIDLKYVSKRIESPHGRGIIRKEIAVVRLHRSESGTSGGTEKFEN